MKTNFKHTFSFNAFQIKMIALITMTLDHISSYQTITQNRTINDGLGIIGRIAAPLFLFMVVEGVRHTRNKTKYLLRLYMAGTVIEIVNRIIEGATEGPSIGNTLPMFFYTALFIICIEHIVNNPKNLKVVCTAICGLIIPFLFYALNIILPRYGYSPAWGIISIFFPSPMNVDYSILFVLMGIAWYFINNRLINCAIFAALSLVCTIIPVSFITTGCPVMLTPAVCSIFDLFVDTQWCMCLAIPFMLLYNGEKGHSLKYLFYIYYPVHVYLLFFILHIRDF